MPTVVRQSARKLRSRADNEFLGKAAEVCALGSETDACFSDVVAAGLLEMVGAW